MRREWGGGCLHEITDQRALTAPITGLSAMAYTAGQVPQHLARAFAKFGAERPRPVHLSVPLDVLEQPLANSTAPKIAPQKRPAPTPRLWPKISALLRASERPVILAGGGAVAASAALQALVERQRRDVRQHRGRQGYLAGKAILNLPGQHCNGCLPVNLLPGQTL